MPYNVELFLERILSLCEERGISKSALSLKAGEVNTIRNIERKLKQGLASAPHVDKVVAMADILETTPDYLLGYKDNHKKQTDLENQAMQTFEIMPVDLQERMLGMMQSELRYYFEKTLSQARQSIENLPLHERQRAIGKITNITNNDTALRLP